MCAVNVATARCPAQTLFHARHAVTTTAPSLPSVARALQRHVCAPCFATSVAGGIRKASQGGSDLPKVAWLVHVSAKARPPVTGVPTVTLAAVVHGCVIHAQSWYLGRNHWVNTVA